MFYRIRKTLHHIIGDWNYFLYNESKHEKRVRNHYYHQSVDNKPSSKIVIYIANGYCNHAGLCDRLKGMTSLYGWSKENGLDFRIFHIHPFNMANYLIPNQYDWIIDEKEICYNRKYTSVNHLMLNNLVRKLIDSGEIASYEKKWFYERIKSSKKQMHFYTNMQPESNYLFGLYFQELFKPAPRLEKILDSHIKSIGNQYISISFRFVQLLGDFIDCDGITLSPKDQEDLINKSLEVIKDIKTQNELIPKILVTADSCKFLDKAKKLPYVYVIEGKVGHINFENSDDVNMKTFLDFLMIAKAQKVYLAKSDKMYNSDFARRAAMIYGKDFKIIEF